MSPSHTDTWRVLACTNTTVAVIIRRRHQPHSPNCASKLSRVWGAERAKQRGRVIAWRHTALEHMTWTVEATRHGILRSLLPQIQGRWDLVRQNTSTRSQTHTARRRIREARGALESAPHTQPVSAHEQQHLRSETQRISKGDEDVGR